MAGKISIDVVANTQELLKGMSRAERVVSRTAKNMGNAIKSFATVFVTGALVNGINSSIKSLDSLNKTASKLGTTTEELSSLGYAAERSGINIKTFEISMQRATRRIAEASNGFGEAKGALKELGVEAESLNNMSLEDKMATLADAFKGVESSSDRLRIAFKLFDTDGAQLVNMLSSGSGALRDMQKESDALGSTIKSSLADEASKAADAITNFSAATTAMTNNLLSSFLPALNSAFFALMDFFDIPRQKGLEELINQSRDLKSEIKDLQKQIADPTWLQKALNADTTRTNLSLLTKELKKVEDKIVSIQTKSETKPLFSAPAKSSLEFANALAKLRANLDPVGTQIKQYYADVSLLDEALQKGAVSQDDYNSMLSNLNDSMPQVSNNMGDVIEETKTTVKTFEAATAASNTFASGLTGAFRQAMDGATNFKDLFANVAKDIIAQLIRILVVQQAVNAAMGAMGFGATTAPVNNNAMAVGVVGTAATGGVIQKSGKYLVGEKGPEIVDLGRGANVIPNGASASASNITINNYGNDNVSATTDDAGNIEIVIAAISNDIMRGTGTIGSSLENRYGLQKV